MKQGSTLQELAIELDRQKAAKRDFLASTPSLALETFAGSPVLKVGTIGTFEVGEYAHEQIGARVGIPSKYYQKMLTEAPALLAENVNHWFKKTPEKRMIRTLDGRARAFLSDRYRPLDHFDLAQPTIETLGRLGCEVQSCELTEKRMYIKATCAKITGQIGKGDLVEAGVMVSNSEIGHGSLSVEPFINRLVCTNGLVVNSLRMRKYHVGRGFDAEGGEQATEFFSDATRRADDRAFFLKINDIIKGTFNQDLFNGVVEQMRAASQREIKASLSDVVEEVANNYSLSEQDQESVLKHLIKGGDLTHWGMVNAITRTAQDQESYDKATEFERLGGQILELPKSEWEQIANAGKN